MNQYIGAAPLATFRSDLTVIIEDHYGIADEPRGLSEEYVEA